MLTYSQNLSSAQDILSHLAQCDTAFVPPLSLRTDLHTYAKKLQTTSVRFEAWSGTLLVGLVAAYFNDPDHGTGFISNVSVLTEFTGQGIAGKLMSNCVVHALDLEFLQLVLDVSIDAHAALRLYSELGFAPAHELPTGSNMLRLVRAIL